MYSYTKNSVSNGKSVFLTNLNLKIRNDYDKIYIYSTSPHQDLYQKLLKCFSQYILIHITKNILIEQDCDMVIEEIVNNEVFKKSDTVIEWYESIEVLKFLQEDDDGGISILDDINEKKTNAPRVQAMLKRSRHNNLSISIISQGY